MEYFRTKSEVLFTIAAFDILIFSIFFKASFLRAPKYHLGGKRPEIEKTGLSESLPTTLLKIIMNPGQVVVLGWVVVPK